MSWKKNVFCGTIYLNGRHLYIVNVCLYQSKREPLQPEKSMKRKRVLRMRKGLKYFLWVKMLTRPANTPNSFSSPRKCSYKHVYTCWITSAPTNPNCFNRKDIQISITLLLQAENITWIWKLSLTQLSFLPLEWYMVLHNNCVFFNNLLNFFAPFSTEKDAYNVNQMLLRGLFGEIWQISRLFANNRISITCK